MGLAGLLGSMVEEGGAIKQRRQMAEMAAQSFDKIGGDQAQYWAKSLRANPRVAWQMAQQYGGVANIENGLMSARAAGQAQEARTQAASSSNLNPMELNAYMRGGGAGLKTMREAQGLGRDAARDRSIWGDGSPGVEGEGGPSQMQMGPEFEYKLALASGDTTKIRTARDRLESAGRTDEEQLKFLRRTDPAKAKAFKESLQTLTNEGVRKLSTDRGKYAAAIPIAFEVRSKLDQMTDFNEPGWEFLIAVELNKALQPDSAVLLSEAQVLYDNLTSEMAKVGRMVEGAWEATGDLDAAGREKLWNMAVDLTDAGMNEYKKLNNAWKKQNKEVYKFDAARDLFTRPGSEYLDRIDQKLSANRPTNDRNSLESASVGDVVTLADGRRVRITRPGFGEVLTDGE